MMIKYSHMCFLLFVFIVCSCGDVRTNNDTKSRRVIGPGLSVLSPIDRATNFKSEIVVGFSTGAINRTAKTVSQSIIIKDSRDKDVLYNVFENGERSTLGEQFILKPSTPLANGVYTLSLTDPTTNKVSQVLFSVSETDSPVLLSSHYQNVNAGKGLHEVKFLFSEKVNISKENITTLINGSILDFDLEQSKTRADNTQIIMRFNNKSPGAMLSVSFDSKVVSNVSSKPLMINKDSLVSNTDVSIDDVAKTISFTVQ